MRDKNTANKTLQSVFLNYLPRPTYTPTYRGQVRGEQNIQHSYVELTLFIKKRNEDTITKQRANPLFDTSQSYGLEMKSEAVSAIPDFLGTMVFCSSESTFLFA